MNDSNSTTSPRREGFAGLLKPFRNSARPLSSSTSRPTPTGSSTHDSPAPTVIKRPSRSRKTRSAPGSEAGYETRPKINDRDKPRQDATPGPPRTQTRSGPAGPITTSRSQDHISSPSHNAPHAPLRRRASTFGRGTRRPDPSPPRRGAPTSPFPDSGAGPPQAKTTSAARGTQPYSRPVSSSAPKPPSLAPSVRKVPQPAEPQTPVNPPILETRRQSIFTNWALKSFHRIPGVPSPSPLSVPSSDAPTESGGENIEKPPKRRKRRWFLPVSEAPTSKKSQNGTKRPPSLGRESDFTETPGGSRAQNNSDREPDPAHTICDASSAHEQEDGDWFSIASHISRSASNGGSEQTLPLSQARRPWESSEERLAPSDSDDVTPTPTPVISSILSCSEVISMLEERGCEDLSSDLKLQECSQHPVSTGGFGDVYIGELHGGTKVAIKTIRPHDPEGLTEGKYQKRSARELYTWSKCDHPNVARLLGLAEFRGRLAMISEWAENGTLPHYIKNNPNANRCSLSTSICEGLVYLHESDIVHGDLKGANILVSGDGTPMLADFGNASLGESTISFTGTLGNNFSLRWTAPEMLGESGSPTRAADVYALGMTILETITGQVPFSNLRDVNTLIAAVHKRKTPKRPEDEIPSQSICGNILWALLMSCWAYNPELRPSAAQVRDHMKLYKPEMLTPIEAEPDSEDDSD